MHIRDRLDFGDELTGERSSKKVQHTDLNGFDETSYILWDKKTEPSSQSMSRGYRIAGSEDEWAWYVVGGCAFANFLLPGMLRSFVPDVLNEFVAVSHLGSDESCKSVSRWIPVTFDLTFFIAGSLSCLLCELTSHGAVTFWGGLIASVGMMSSTFANSIPYLYISYGIMVGVGAGLCYPAGILIVNEYFTGYRGLANGLSLVGTTVGSIALPPYIKLMTSSYGYRGGILIVSGMMLNVLVTALIYKPVADRHWRDIEAVTSTPNRVSHSEHCRSGRIRLFGGTPAAVLMVVCAVNAIGHLACSVFATIIAPRTVARRITAAADVAACVLAPVASDLLSSRGCASTWLYVVAAAVGGTVLLAAADPSSLRDPSPHLQWLLVAFGLASGAAVGLEPLVAVHVLGRERLAVACSAALLGKGAAQLAVDLLLLTAAVAPPRAIILGQTVALYTLGFGLLAVAAAFTTAFLARRCRRVTVVGSGGDGDGCCRYKRTA